MSKVIVTKEKLDTLANTIAYKSGVPVTMTIDEMDAAVKSIKTEIYLEEKTVTPSEKQQVIKPSENYDGLSSVTVKPIPEDYLVPNLGELTVYPNTNSQEFFADDEGYDGYSYVAVEPMNLESKTVTPTEQQQTVTASSGYDGISEVTVDGIDSTYVGSGVTRRTSTDLTASGETITVPSGYYSENASKSVATATQATPSVSINSITGLVTATSTQSAGYVSAGTKSGTLQLTTKSGTTITPTEEEQEAVAANVYTTGQVKVGAISSTYVGSDITQRSSSDVTASGPTVTVPGGYYPSGVERTISSTTHPDPSVSINSTTGVVTASHTQSTGYVVGGTTSDTLELSTQAAKTVTPTESSQQAVAAGVYTTGAVTVAPIPDEYIVPDGTITITQNGTYDVTEKAEASVNVSGSLIQRDVENTTGVTREITGDMDVITPLTVTENGTYTAGSGVTGYSPVTVNVSGSGTSAKALNLIDYDGSIVESYTAAEAQALTALPDNPTHTGLIAQGWNWSLADIKAALTAHPDRPVNVGQMYKTASGKTEIDVTFNDPEYLSPYLAICPNGTCTIDWGDGSETETVTGTSYTTLKYTPHIYANTGSYTITIDGNVGFRNTSYSNSGVLSINASMTNKQTYSQCITAIRLSETSRIDANAFTFLGSLKYIIISKGVTSIGAYAFRYCYALTSITIPDNVTSIANYAFQNCYALISIIIPNGVTSITNSMFNSCYSLSSITIPDSVTSIGSSVFNSCYSLSSITIPDSATINLSNAFQYCNALTSITIPDSVTSIGTYGFQNCYILPSITIPDGVTNIDTYAFQNCYALTSITIPDSVTSIGNYAFYNCYALSSITIPDSVTSIGNSVFYNCYSILQYHFTSITPPTLGTNVFSGITSDNVIYVPQESVEAYKTATNWSSYADYIQGE